MYMYLDMTPVNNPLIDHSYMYVQGLAAIVLIERQEAA